MLNTILLLSLAAFCIQGIFCQHDLLSKFIQHGYKIKDKRTDLVRFNKSFFHFAELKTFKYNRTTTAHNCTFKLKIDVEDKTEALVQVYKFLSNEYRHFPIRFQVNVKKAYDSNAIGLSALLACGNVTDLVFYKDVIYHVGNFVVDENRFPPLIPNGIYKAEVVLLYLNQEIAVVHLFGEIYTPIDYPKK